MLADCAAPITLLSRYCWRHVYSAEPFAAVLLPGDDAPVIAVNDTCVGTVSEIGTIAYWADRCLASAETVAFLMLADYRRLRSGA